MFDITKKNDYATNKGGWKDSAMRKWLNEDVLPRLPKELQAMIVPRTIRQKINGEEVQMPPKELELLFFLSSNPNKVYTRDQLLEYIWGYDFFGDSRTVDVHIKRLREKVEDPKHNWQIKTVWGIGYKFEVKQ